DESTPIAQRRGPDRRHVGRHGRVRPYRPSGLYRQPSPAPEVEQAMDHLRAQLLTDKGGPDAVTTAERVLIDVGRAGRLVAFGRSGGATVPAERQEPTRCDV